MSFIDGIKERAKKDIKTIVLPESEDERTLRAAAKILEEKTANLILIGDEATVKADAEKYGVNVDGATIINPETSDKLEEYVNTLYELRKAKGMTPEAAREALLKDRTTFGVMVLKTGGADGLVSGACHSTANTLRPADRDVNGASCEGWLSNNTICIVRANYHTFIWQKDSIESLDWYCNGFIWIIPLKHGG